VVTVLRTVIEIDKLAARKRAAELEFALAAAHGRHDEATRLREEFEEIERQIELAPLGHTLQKIE
jgi:hypothetical protein